MALTRKNALFAGNEVGAENWAMLASLVATCKMSGVNPVDYLTNTLRAILEGHPKSRIEDLMLWRHPQPSSLAAKGHVVALTGLQAGARRADTRAGVRSSMSRSREGRHRCGARPSRTAAPTRGKAAKAARSG
jgi:hypothetical protein